MSGLNTEPADRQRSIRARHSLPPAGSPATAGPGGYAMATPGLTSAGAGKHRRPGISPAHNKDILCLNIMISCFFFMT